MDAGKTCSPEGISHHHKGIWSLTFSPFGPGGPIGPGGPACPCGEQTAHETGKRCLTADSPSSPLLRIPASEGPMAHGRDEPNAFGEVLMVLIET